MMAYAQKESHQRKLSTEMPVWSNAAHVHSQHMNKIQK